MVRAPRRPFALLAACLGLAAVAGCAAAGSTRPAGTAAASARPPQSTSSRRRSGSRSRGTQPRRCRHRPRGERRRVQLPRPPGGQRLGAFAAGQGLAHWSRRAYGRRAVLRAERRLPVERGQAGLRQRRPRLHRPAADGRPGRRRHLVRRLDDEGPGAQRGAGLQRADKQQAVPGLRYDPARRHGSAGPRPWTSLTSRGTASVPAWAFTLKGVSSPVIQAALAPGSYLTPYTDGSSAEKLAPLGTAFVGGDP